MDFLASLDFTALWRFREPILWGLLTSVWMAAAAFVIALPMGLLLALARWKGAWPLRLPATALVDVMRFTPLLVQAVWIHFALPVLTGASTTATQSGLVALTLHVSAYVCEVLRSGLVAIPNGQWEAGRALGLNRLALFRLVILPQVWPLILPPLANLTVTTLKLTAILGILAINDLTKVANRVNSAVFRPVEVYTVVALCYLAVGLVLAAGAKLVERRFNRSRQRVVPQAEPIALQPAFAAGGPGGV